MSHDSTYKKSHTCKVASIGAWGSYFPDTAALADMLNAPICSSDEQLKEKTLDEKLTEENPAGKYSAGPKPEAIPANERRRAPLIVRLAVEASWQATQKVGISPQDLKCVFVSGLGDTSLTDYMCSVLASDMKKLSPTKFHNSVHNAPAGYWTISTEVMGAANSVAGFEHSVAVTLMDAIIQCNYEKAPILIAFYDAPVAEPFKALLKNEHAFAAAIVIYPEDSDKEGTRLTMELSSVQQDAFQESASQESASQQNTSINWPVLATNNSYLQDIYTNNPAGKVLCLLERLLSPAMLSSPFTLPVSDGVSIRFTCSQ